jgi:hypothetical protein
VPASPRFSPNWWSASCACAFAAASVDDVREEDVLGFVLERAPADLLAAHVQVAEDAHLGAEDLRIDRLEQVIDRALLVAFEDVGGLAAQRGDEDDGDVARLLALLDQLRRLQAVQARHLHVQQDHREGLAQQVEERVFAGAGLDQARPQRLQDAL